MVLDRARHLELHRHHRREERCELACATSTPYERVHLVQRRTVQIVSSKNITEWRFTEER
jgi:hypothetical protein